MIMLISTINFRIYNINSSYNVLILLYILQHNYFIRTLFIINFFIISFPILFIILQKIISCENLGSVHKRIVVSWQINFYE